MKKILILNGHPYPQSFNNAIAETYYRAAKDAGHEAELVHIRNLTFDPVLWNGSSEPTELESDLKKQQELLLWCNHLVVVTPVWWMQFPSLLKGYLDRVLTSGFAFRYKKSRFFGLVPNWDKLLAGRSCRVMYTQGSPQWIFRYILLDSLWRCWHVGIFGFCGFKPIKRLVMPSVPVSTDTQRQQWLKRVKQLGQRGV